MISELVDRVYKAKGVMKNASMTTDELTHLKREFMQMFYVFPTGTLAKFDTFLGCSIIPVDRGFILFERCDYCHSGRLPEERDGIFVCVKCGAPMEQV